MTRTSLKIPSKAILVTHGKIGEAFYEALKPLFGEIPDLKIISNERLSFEALEKKVKDAISQLKPANILIFTDIPGGSCAQVCEPIVQDQKAIRLINSVNLPMLIKFFQYRDRTPFNKLVKLVKTAGKKEIK